MNRYLHLTVCVEEVQRNTFSISSVTSKLLFCLVKGKDPEVFHERLLENRQESQQHDTYHNMSKVSPPLVTNTTATTQWGSTEPSRLATAARHWRGHQSVGDDDRGNGNQIAGPQPL